MANIINVAGLATIKVDTVSGGEVVGYTQDGVEITYNGYFLDVPTDEHGGTDGPPVDVQYLGETVTIRLLMTKYDQVVVDKLKPRVDGQSLGVVATANIGTLMMATAKSFRLCIICATTADLSRNFPITIFRDPIEVNKGTKFSRLLLVGTAYRDSATGLLWNKVTTFP